MCLVFDKQQQIASGNTVFFHSDIYFGENWLYFLVSSFCKYLYMYMYAALEDYNRNLDKTTRWHAIQLIDLS